MEASHQESFTVRHFKLVYRSGEVEEVATRLLEELEKSLATLTLEWGFSEPSSHIEVILYPNESFEQSSGHAPKWASGLFDGRIRLSYDPNMLESPQSQEGLIKTARHELIRTSV